MTDRASPYRTLNPATGALLDSYELATASEIETSLEAAATAARGWQERPIDERGALLRALAETLEERRDALSALMATEMGKPVVEGRAEVDKCAWACRYYAENAERFLAPEPAESDGSEAWIRFDPIGPVLAIMPWNFPLWQVFRFAAPTLAAGNTVVLKHAPNTPGCALAIHRLFADLGADDLLQTLFLSDEQAAGVIRDRRIRGVTLTGSTRAGSAVAAIAGAALKPTVMELGGSDAFVVFADADIAAAAEVGALSRCLNSGQSCIAAKRFLVESSAAAAFTEALVGHMGARKMGDPAEETTDLGPLARDDLRRRLATQVDATRAEGARVLLGGSPEDGPGFYYPATVLADVTMEMTAAHEELFGPVAAVSTFDDEDDAVRMAGATRYGLGASLWTEDPDRARRLLPRIDAGAVFVNGLVKSDPRLPFGGIKDSGFGRELGRDGMLEFVNRKTVWMR